ncbi:MAG: 3-deoxy-7-phosphoheptulonate synthase, partial [Gemmatimonadetes bacterium]|nr:3-deoxy-7-phosphoheptulonate synthase [Gemmatimonadota bacterium]
MSEHLEEVRKQLDTVDRRIVESLAERLELVSKVAEAKGAGAPSLRDREREEEILGRITESARAVGIDESFLVRLYREIMDHSLRRQRALLDDESSPDEPPDILVVGYQGTEGAYSHVAATRHFGALGGDIVYRGYDTFEQIGTAVQEGDIDRGIVPVENTTAGSINDVYDLLAACDLSIVGEEVQVVDHCLMAPKGASLAGVRTVYSHPQALLQCSQFLARQVHARAESYTDTAMAARKVRDDGDLSRAAIASEEAARLYGLVVLQRGIANQAENFTRFVTIAREPLSGDVGPGSKTSVVFSVRHEGGALAACLDVFARHGLNLTKIESRPRPNSPWQYLFYLDFEGDVADENVVDVFRELAAHTTYLKFLGSYPSWSREDRRPARPRRIARSDSGGDEALRPAAAPVPEDVKDAIAAALEKKPYRLASRITRTTDTEIVVGHVAIGGARPVVIAGPCSVESREQVFACARIVSELGGDLLRGGCFKPRTSPYSFQGMGYEGLDLLAEAGREYGLPVVTEVLHPSDVGPVAEKADVLQVGARNMQNFSLLKEIGRSHRAVVLKRGMMSSVDEWLSAAEYILSHGNQQVILCERGIRTFETATRATLDLTVVPVVRERSHLPLIVDPSHACGTSRWVPDLTRAALAAGAQGVMIEIHPEPERALSDGPQALRFDAFTDLMAEAAMARS